MLFTTAIKCLLTFRDFFKTFSEYYLSDSNMLDMKCTWNDSERREMSSDVPINRVICVLLDV